jgi:hypothetical protein
VTRFIVPSVVIAETTRALRGTDGERTALWQGPVDETPVRIVRAVVPEQRSIRSSASHAVHVAGAELARIQFDAHDLGLRTWIQLHTHPSRHVGMSELDVQWAIVDFPGAVSIIVPSFGEHGLSEWPGVAAYERDDVGWRLWTRRQMLASIEVQA